MLFPRWSTAPPCLFPRAAVESKSDSFAHGVRPR